MNPNERDQLIDDLLEGTLSEADFLRLEAEFCVDPVARRAYYDRVALSQSLAEEAHLAAEQPAFRRKTKLRALSRYWPAVAAVLVVSLAVPGMWWQSRKIKSLAAVEETKASGFGVLVDQVGAQWSVSGLHDGAMLPAGKLELRSGVAHVELFSGVSLVLEGPAEFEILSAMEIDLPRGRLRARVPETAHGFRVRTAEGDIVDLGTEFAIASTAEGAEVRVLDGEIEWHPAGLESGEDEMLLMRKGEALQTAGGAVPSAGDFAGLEEFRQRHDAESERQREAWIERCRVLDGDPRLFAHYRFATGDHSRQLRNLSSGSGRPGSGAVVAAVAAEDRWGQSGAALDFSATGSRVRLHVPGVHESLTLVCWVRINSLDRLYNSLFLTDGHEVGAPHWQILDDGRLFFSLKRFAAPPGKGRPDKHDFYSSPVWDISRGGQWMQLAVVYDVTSRTVTQYADGRIVGRETIPNDYLVKDVHMGNASIGNWSEPVYRPDPEFVVRNLNGSFDEFLLFSAALSDQEIRELHETGSP